MFKKRTIKKDNVRSVRRRNSDEDTPLMVTAGSQAASPVATTEQSEPIEPAPKKRALATVGAAHTPSALAGSAQTPNTAVTGPLKAVPVNIKTTTVVDFQPDVCKDFLQTGYCGYGDTCKFLHIRDELKQKKPVVKEWEMVERPLTCPLQPRLEDGQLKLPFRCVLCKKDYTLPVMTNCGHLYCQKCFLDRFKRKPSCFICGKDTLGICRPVPPKELAELI